MATASVVPLAALDKSIGVFPNIGVVAAACLVSVSVKASGETLATVSAAVVAASPAVLPPIPAAPNALPKPNPVRPDIMPCFKSPDCIALAIPEPIAPATGADNPVNKAVPAILPNSGAKKGKKASGCPVSGFFVNGIIDANPCTSAGLTCNNILSP